MSSIKPTELSFLFSPISTLLGNFSAWPLACISCQRHKVMYEHAGHQRRSCNPFEIQTIHILNSLLWSLRPISHAHSQWHPLTSINSVFLAVTPTCASTLLCKYFCLYIIQSLSTEAQHCSAAKCKMPQKRRRDCIFRLPFHHFHICTRKHTWIW